VKELQLLLDSCRSDSTKKQYAFHMKKYFDFVGHLPKGKDQIEQKMLDYILFLKKQGASYHSIHIAIAPVKSFYSINDVVINVKKIGKFLPEYKKIRKDRAYTHEEIGRLLEIADERLKVLILLLASSGIRLGAVPSIKLENLEENRIIVYEGSNEEYHTFITPECKNAIKNYLDMRSRYGEKLDNDSYLLREQFDVRCPGKPKPFNFKTIQTKLYDLCRRSGIDKKNVAIAHGFRKFFTTQVVNSKVNSEIREMLLGHKIGLASAYYRPTEQEMYAEYEKAIDNLTINEENRLRRKVEILEVEKTRMDRIELQIKTMQEDMKEK